VIKNGDKSKLSLTIFFILSRIGLKIESYGWKGEKDDRNTSWISFL